MTCWEISPVTRIDAVHPSLGRDLRGSVRTGTWCAFQRPNELVNWRL